MKALGCLTGVVLLALVAACSWIAYLRFSHPSLEPYARYALPAASAPSAPGKITATFFGVATVLITDGETALMTDGFFTRPGGLIRLGLGAEIRPDRDVVERSLSRAGVDELAAVIVVHSHYDHAMDAPLVAELTGATLVGSDSTANVGRGWGLDENSILVATPGEPLAFGKFTVTLILSRHFPLRFGKALLGKDITEPLEPPATIYDYFEGGSYSVLVEHPLGSILVQGSAGFIEGGLAGYRADLVLLGVGALGTAAPAYKEEYFHELVETVGARRVVPIHWDDFMLPPGEPLRANADLFDDVASALDYLIVRAEADPSLSFHMMREWEPVVLFETTAGEAASAG